MATPILFSPGPVMVEDNVMYSLLHYDICHRGKDFEMMFNDTREKICSLCGADDMYDSVIVSGSGTSASEAVISSIVVPSEKILLISNGMFGERLEEIITKYKIPMIKTALKWGEIPNIDVSKKKSRVLTLLFFLRIILILCCVTLCSCNSHIPPAMNDLHCTCCMDGAKAA